LTGPLTAREIADHFEIRASLEPAALCKAGPHLSSAWLASMLQKTQGYKGRQLTAAELELLEEDLHIRCLEACFGNRDDAELIRLIFWIMAIITVSSLSWTMAAKKILSNKIKSIGIFADFIISS
jgi:DNA-binding GntR family transcriptional regulator